MSDGRIPLTIPLKPWFLDHSIGGRVVLPAVETMLLLAAKVAEVYPEIEIRVMENVRFSKFLDIPPEAVTLDCFVECQTCSDGRVRAKLLSRIQFKVMSRIKDHGEIFFSPVRSSTCQGSSPDPAPLKDPVTKISAKHLYRELVPFGPAYQTLQETLFLSETDAWGRLRAPVFPGDPVQKIIGSPFPLDGALHAACVLGQQSVDFVPFPVGFDRRVITRPTQPGCCYQTRITQISGPNDELVFDLGIYDKKGMVCECITGLRMRDVGGVGIE